jgi:hypothetical protein
MLTLRDLNRATLTRQYLLERHKEDVVEVPPRPVREPWPPYLGVSSRLEAFDEPDAATRSLGAPVA